MSKIESEKIVIVRPLGYLNFLGEEHEYETIQTKGKMVEAKRLFWRIYWVGFRSY